LTKKEGFEQGQYRLVRDAEEREDWLEEEDLRSKKAKLKCREANNHSQKKCRKYKHEQEIADGVRDVNGKIKKVCIVWYELEMKLTAPCRSLSHTHFALQTLQF